LSFYLFSPSSEIRVSLETPGAGVFMSCSAKTRLDAIERAVDHVFGGRFGNESVLWLFH
jgi:hypothetical protein